MSESSDKVGLYESRGVIEDSVHGFIPINTAEYWILQTPFMRRLHNVKQLGMAYLVFPSARHSRLEHSLGAMHVMQLMAQRIVTLARHNSKVCEHILVDCNQHSMDAFIQLARLVGLLHDIGHLAYSHMTENALFSIALQGAKPIDENAKRLYDELSSYSSGKGLKVHEAYTRALIERLIRKASEDREAMDFDEIQSLLRLAAEALEPQSEQAEKVLEELGLRNGALSVIHEMISNEIADADRLDYLQRDAQSTGIVYGNIDLERLIRGIRVNVTDKGPHLALDVKSLQTLEDIFDARYKMYRSVYYHHKVIAISKAVTRFLTYLASEWDKLALPLYRGHSIYEVLLPSKLAEAIDANLYYFDDSELDVMLKISTTLTGSQSSRWAKALLDERDLLPISLFKRSEELAIMARKIIEEKDMPYTGQTVTIILNNITAKAEVLEDTLRSALTVDITVDYFEDEVIDPSIMKGSGLEVLNWGESPYLRALISEGSIPVVYLYAYSDNVEDHRNLRRMANELREKTRKIVEDLMREAASRLRT